VTSDVLNTRTELGSGMLNVRQISSNTGSIGSIYAQESPKPWRIYNHRVCPPSPPTIRSPPPLETRKSIMGTYGMCGRLLSCFSSAIDRTVKYELPIIREASLPFKNPLTSPLVDSIETFPAVRLSFFNMSLT
jgi:hypothetical protein